jgi:hypothetical protein
MPKKKAPANTNNDVGEALALLSETLTEEEARIRDEGADAMKAGAYDTATDVIDFARQLLAFQGKVAALADEWEQIEDVRDAATPEVQEIVSKRFFGRRKSGEITSMPDFFRPLLESLVEMGGSGKLNDVLDRIGEKMKEQLKASDWESHKSPPHQIRWRNTAEWARNHMVNKSGLMKKGSPRGIWEISDKGREWLERQ